MTDWQEAKRKADNTAKWAVTMTKVRIRQVLARTRWQLVTFLGPSGSESKGVVDLLAIRKDHRTSPADMKRGDALQMVLIQVKGGRAAMPTPEDAKRLRAVARRHGAGTLLLAKWTKGKAAVFYNLRRNAVAVRDQWAEVNDLETIFK